MKLQDFVQDKPVLETEQLILRPLRKEDVADLKEWLGDSSIYQYWGKRPGKSDLNPELLFQKPENLGEKFSLGCCLNKQDHKVGYWIYWVYLIENDPPRQSGISSFTCLSRNRFMTSAARIAICFEETETTTFMG